MKKIKCKFKEIKNFQSGLLILSIVVDQYNQINVFNILAKKKEKKKKKENSQARVSRRDF